MVISKNVLYVCSGVLAVNGFGIGCKAFWQYGAGEVGIGYAVIRIIAALLLIVAGLLAYIAVKMEEKRLWEKRNNEHSTRCWKRYTSQRDTRTWSFSDTNLSGTVNRSEYYDMRGSRD